MSSSFQIGGWWNCCSVPWDRWLFGLALFCVLLLGLVPAVAGLETPSSDQSRASLSSGLHFSSAEKAFTKTRDVFRIGIINDFPPFCYTEDPQNASPRYKGFTVDLVHLLAQKTGLTLNIQFNTWSRNYNDFQEETGYHRWDLPSSGKGILCSVHRPLLYHSQCGLHP